ncbi:MAG: DUF2283 domain-containing protein [Anaerolineales bacterium]|nr:DUF2283 domain-containing protein [Anaerolineales bacterium]
MKISYNREADILLVEMDAHTGIDHAEQNGPVILHLSREDRPVLIEILNASEFLSTLVKVATRAEPVTVSP